MKRVKFAVCLIFFFVLHARWLDLCQIGSLSGDFWGEIPAMETGMLGESAGALVC